MVLEREGGNKQEVGSVLRRGERFRAGMDNKVDGGAPSREKLVGVNVEIRLADLEKDAAKIASIFGEPDNIEHLAGVAPALTKRNIVEFRSNIAKYMPEMPGVDEEGLKDIAKGVIIATKDEIRGRLQSPNIELYVAEIGGRVVGTVTLEKPSGAGIRWGGISKIAVTQEAKGLGVGRKLFQAVNSRMFDQLGYSGAAAGIIRGVDGDSIPLRMFENNGWHAAGTLPYICLGWSRKEEKFVYRNSIRVQRVIPQGSAIKAA